MSVLANERELQQMVGEGQMMEAFEKFYHDDVIMIEPMAGEIKGRKPKKRS